MKTKLWNGELMDIGPCLGCGFSGEDYVCREYVRGAEGTLSCDNCHSKKGVSYRDAAGNVISFPKDGLKNNFTDALGESVTSKKQYSEILKREGLRQNGGVFTNGRSMGRYRRAIRV